MSWSDPSGHVYVTGEVVTAATLNTYIKDNLLDLDRRTTLGSGDVETGQTTASTTYTDLATAGPSASCTVGVTGNALVVLTCAIQNDTVGAVSYMSVALSGAQTLAAADSTALSYTTETANHIHRASIVVPMSPAVGGIIFTAKYRVTGGTATFTNRRIGVLAAGA